jgi:hypothetical protein
MEQLFKSLTPALSSRPIYEVDIASNVPHTISNNFSNNLTKDFSKEEISDSKKSSVDSAKYSADVALKDKSLKENFVSCLSFLFGLAVFFSSVGNVYIDIKKQRKSLWVYFRIIIDFVASGVLIGYALNYTIWGLGLGFSVGILAIVIELKMIKNKPIG